MGIGAWTIFTCGLVGAIDRVVEGDFLDDRVVAQARSWRVMLS